jgi:4-amino-4-deoxy-L-arabinose transferase-like glycosyltransferase
VKDLSTRSQAHSPSGVDPAPQITTRAYRFWPWFGVGLSLVLFNLYSLVFIPKVGLEDDEVIFTSPLYLFSAKEFGMVIFHHRVPLMVMTYIGTLKTLLYLPILAVFGANLWSLRLPIVVVGTATIWMFYKLASRSASPAAGLVAVFLLATDPSFLFTNTVDWGPVALEHFLLVTGCFFIVRFAQDANRGSLALGFFLLGLALWNKAIFVWALAGLSCGAIAIFWPEIRRLLRPATACIAVASFLGGALPFVIFNVRNAGNQNMTFRASGHLETDKFAGKASMLRATLDGSALFGFLFGLDDAPNPKTPQVLNAQLATRIPMWVGDHFGKPRRTPMFYAYILALLLVPWWWKYRAARFSLVFMGVAWLAMAVTKDAGGSAHHTVLLWPFPQFFLAAALAALPWRMISTAAVALLVAMNLLLLNQGVADVERYGTPGNFNNASIGLVREFSRISAPIAFTLDWGMVNLLAFSQKGHLDLHMADGSFQTDPPTQDQLREIDWIFAQPGALFVDHLPGYENYPTVRPNLERAAAARGFHKEKQRIISDSNGRPVFEIFGFGK